MNGTELLIEYRLKRSNDAFAGLVRRYANLVYSAAKRRLLDVSLAEETAQVVFARLAQAPPQPGNDAELSAWLHRTTTHVAIDVWRSETRRRAREQTAAMMQLQSAAAETNRLWDEVAPMLDEALDGLADPDRQVLSLRFFERKAMREIGDVLKISEDAAKARVSRAVERLRSQLALRGVTCAAGALGLLIDERSMEAAPAKLIAEMSALAGRAPVAAAGVAAWLVAWLGRLQANPAGTVLVVMALVTAAGLLARSWNRDNHAAIAPVARPASPGQAYQSAAPRIATLGSGVSPVASATIRMRFQVLDAETGAGLPGAKLRIAYFYVGGRGEGHDVLTDANGVAAIPGPLEPHDQGMNVFVHAEGYVPKSMGFNPGSGPEYVTRLDRGRSVGGIVVNQSGEPVEGVKIQVQGPGNKPGAKENIDFQTVWVTSDADGRWLCNFVPMDFESIDLILTRDDYAVTLPRMPASQANSTNLVLVIDRGFAVTGRVTDSEARPLRGVLIKEVTTTRYRRQSVTTDADGRFILMGTGEWESYMGSQPETNEQGALVARGLTASGEAFVNLSVEAEGFAPVLQKVPLLTPTNIANFTLTTGNVLLGRIVDETGKAVSGAIARTDSDNGLIKHRWWANADADGRFVWMSAPAEPTLFWFEAPGFKPRRHVLLKADGTPQEIKLER